VHCLNKFLNPLRKGENSKLVKGFPCTQKKKEEVWEMVEGLPVNPVPGKKKGTIGRC